MSISGVGKDTTTVSLTTQDTNSFPDGFSGHGMKTRDAPKQKAL